MSRGKGWRGEPGRHSLASKGIKTAFKDIHKFRKEDISANLVVDILNESEYLNAVDTPSDEFSAVDFTFEIDGRHDIMKGSLSFHPQTPTQALLRCPNIQNLEEVKKLKRIAKEIDETIPYDLSIEFRFWEGENPLMTPDFDVILEQYRKGKDLRPHIVMKSFDKHTPNDVYEFAETFANVVTKIGKEMEDKNE